MSFRLESALEVTDALWDLVPVIVTAGEQHDHQAPGDVADMSPAGRRLTGERRTQIRQLADMITAAQEAALAGHDLDASALIGVSLREMIADPFGFLGPLLDMPGQVSAALSAVRHVSDLSQDDMFYLRAYMKATLMSDRTPVLLRALFVTTIGTVEPLVTRLIQLLLYYAEPQVYTSLADPELEDKARQLCFGGPGKWRTSLVDQLGVTTLAEAIRWDQLANLWEDRNVIVHRASVTDTRHSGKTSSPAGTVITPDPTAVRSAIDIVGAARFALAACVWSHLDPGTRDVVAVLAGPVVFESLCAGRWQQAGGLARVQELLAADPEDRANGQVNRWLAIDIGRGPEAIRAEVEAWDPGGLPAVYQLARLVLLREDERAPTLMDRLLDDLDIDPAARASVAAKWRRS